jgi:hypothetical protein
LTQRLTRDCGQFPDWKSVYIGSLKKFPRCHENLTLYVKLQQIGVPYNKATAARRPAFQPPQGRSSGSMCSVSDGGFNFGSITDLSALGIHQTVKGAGSKYASGSTARNGSFYIEDFTVENMQPRLALNKKVVGASDDCVPSHYELDSYDEHMAPEVSRSNTQTDHLSQWESLPIKTPMFDSQMGVIRTLNDSKKRCLGSEVADFTAPYESQTLHKRLKRPVPSGEESVLTANSAWHAKSPSRPFESLKTGNENESLDVGYHHDMASDSYANQMSHLSSSEDEMFLRLLDDFQPSELYDANDFLSNDPSNDPFGHPTTNA